MFFYSEGVNMDPRDYKPFSLGTGRQLSVALNRLAFSKYSRLLGKSGSCC